METLDGGSLSAYFLSANRGKKSIAIDLKTEIGQRIIRALASESDVLIENFKTGNLAKYGLDYSTLKKINPKLIYCSITGFGQTGPYSTFPGYDYVIQAMSGLMSVTGEKNGLPMRVGIPVADLFTGLNAVVGILAALYFRQQTGKGQHIDLALFDTMVSMLSTQNMNYLVGKQTPSRTGIRNPNVVPYQLLKTRNGYIVIAVGNDDQFQKLCSLLELDDLKHDKRFITNSARLKNQDDLIEKISRKVATHSLDFLLKACAKIGVPAGPVNSIPEALSCEQIKHREIVFNLESSDTIEGFIPQLRNPLKFSEMENGSLRTPPKLGQNTDEILRFLGFKDSDIDYLKKSKAIQ